MEIRRIIRKPNRFGEWEEGDLQVKRAKSVQKLWEVEDILEMRGEEVLVKWKDWNGPNSWVSLKNNPELRAFIAQNIANPTSSTLASQKTIGTIDNTDMMALKQAIFDNLGDARYTLDGSRGRQRRVTVKLPFRPDEFQHFRKIQNVNPYGNVDCYIRGEELDAILGDGWSSRCYKTSTKTYINYNEYIRLAWGYKERSSFDHTKCSRCTWEGDETERPELCNASVKPLQGPPWLSLTYT